ncbi:hypothetical protein BOTBODRAFT_313852 [Botryobasidium botryosum FD-172 SS1]|uniref:Uncharacterized protein n=1 Tax=Botryobasidium botryosum (strain FD-172 SS1) TaxID=930990 RepID=A0A067NA08_BOTB1|nr:hypothetical protein BOTBODRAFT_313852 [Botryobasidium botryosum FD-172 SS1]
MAEEIQEFSKSFLLEQTPLTIQETRALLPLPKESSIPNIFPTSYSLPLQNTEMGVEPLTLDDEAYEAWSINNATDITTPNKSPGSMLPPQTPPLSPSNSISDAGSPTSFLFSPTRNNTGGVGSPKAPSKKRPIDLEESDSSEAQPPSTKRKVETPVKKNVIDSITVHSTPPRNKSVQQAAHAKSFKKLSSPFRSPLLVAPPAASSASSTSKTIASTSSFAMPKALTSKPAHDSGLFSKLKALQAVQIPIQVAAALSEAVENRAGDPNSSSGAKTSALETGS